jgi:hypothetical protein
MDANATVFMDCLTLTLETLQSIETSVRIQQSTWRNIPEELSLQQRTRTAHVAAPFVRLSTALQLGKTFPAFYRNRKFITVLKKPVSALILSQMPASSLEFVT